MDAFNPPEWWERGSSQYKEWHHFCVQQGEIDLIVNLNLSADTRPAASSAQRIARVCLLVRNRNGWDGAIETAPSEQVDVARGRVDVFFGNAYVKLRHGRYEVAVSLTERPIALRLIVEPLCTPLQMRNNVAIGSGRINWLVVPRAASNGTLIVDERVYKLSDAPTYHDHNWGSWLWGDDFSWWWGYALPDDLRNPWTVVFDLTSDRARGQVLELTLALWKGTHLFRVLTQQEVRVTTSAPLAPAALFKLPRVLSLLRPEETSDVPSAIYAEGVARDDFLKLRFESVGVSQILIPNETDLGETTINEVSGRATVVGRIRGEEVQMDGRGVFEFLT